jgi:hypothetical protein
VTNTPGGGTGSGGGSSSDGGTIHRSRERLRMLQRNND